jgi:hypothetical protein
MARRAAHLSDGLPLREAAAFELQHADLQGSIGRPHGSQRRTSALARTHRCRDSGEAAHRGREGGRPQDRYLIAAIFAMLSLPEPAVLGSLQFGEMQGDVDEMQGGGKHKQAKCRQISIVWMGLLR